MKLVTTIPWLKNVSIFQELNEEAFEELSEITEIITTSSDELIFSTGEEADALYVVISGLVQIIQTFKDGRKKTLALMSAGDFFGEMAIISSQKRCASAITGEPSTLLKIEKEQFLSLLKIKYNVCFGILKEVCNRLRMVDDEIGHLTFQNLPGRIAIKLLDLATKIGVSREEGVFIEDVTHNQLAELVGTNRESVSKYMSLFNKEGSVSSKKKEIIITNREKLMAWC